MGKCNFSDVVLNSGGYIAEFSSQRGATCFRLFHERSGREILRFPKAEETFLKMYFFMGILCCFRPTAFAAESFPFAEESIASP